MSDVESMGQSHPQAFVGVSVGLGAACLGVAACYGLAISMDPRSFLTAMMVGLAALAVVGVAAALRGYVRFGLTLAISAPSFGLLALLGLAMSIGTTGTTSH